MEKNKETVLQIKLMMRGVSPTVWRKLQFKKDASFMDLHDLFQKTMGWTGRYLFEFRMNDPKEKELCVISNKNDFDADVLPANRVLLTDIFTEKNQRGHYVYNLETNWLFEVKFEGFVPLRPRAKFPLFHSGRRTAPPEDIGGVWGYEHYRDCILDQQHEEHLLMLEHFCGGDFDMRKYPEILEEAKASFEARDIDTKTFQSKKG